LKKIISRCNLKKWKNKKSLLTFWGCSGYVGGVTNTRPFVKFSFFGGYCLVPVFQHSFRYIRIWEISGRFFWKEFGKRVPNDTLAQVKMIPAVPKVIGSNYLLTLGIVRYPNTCTSTTSVKLRRNRKAGKYPIPEERSRIRSSERTFSGHSVPLFIFSLCDRTIRGTKFRKTFFIAFKNAANIFFWINEYLFSIILE